MKRESFPPRKTKVICTIGPASQAPETLQAMIGNGMDVARLNLSHGSLESHAQVVCNIRMAASDLGQRVEFWGDLPGCKMRIGRLTSEPVRLVSGQPFILRTNECLGDATCASVSYHGLAEMVQPGVDVYLSDGVVHLSVDRVEGTQVFCRVLVGGLLHSNDGINLPCMDLGLGTLDGQDQICLAFAAEQKLDAISPSFIRDAADIDVVRQAAAELSYSPLVLAKIERTQAVRNFDALLESADAIVIARGDLGVETPLEEIALLQKQLIRRSNLAGKPVITATHLLQSMVNTRFPTRAEVADVTNAILDGSDCLTLCAETAIGNYPAEAVAVLTCIARATERHIAGRGLKQVLEVPGNDEGIGSATRQGGRDSIFGQEPGLNPDRQV